MRAVLSTLGIAFGAVLALVLLLSLAFGGRLFNLEMNKFFKPREMAVEREVFVNTPSYVRGKEQRIVDLCLDWRRSETDGHRKILADTILLEAAEVDQTQLNPQARACINDVQGGF